MSYSYYFKSRASVSELSVCPTIREFLDESRNVFRSPWKNSDVVLVVGSTEFHLHRWILSTQSPVFERMLDGKRSPDRITIERKSAKDMLGFLMRLYPANMIAQLCQVEMPVPDYVKILPIADHYQAENVIAECLREIKITPENALTVLPYAEQHNSTTVRGTCFQVIKNHVGFDAMAVDLKSIKDDKLAREVHVLSEKCKFLEQVVSSTHGVIMELVEEVADHLSHCRRRMGDFDGAWWNCRCTTAKGCGHEVSVKSLHEAKKCENCLEAYKMHFTTKLGNDYGRMPEQKKKPQFDLFELLSVIDDINHSTGEEPEDNSESKPEDNSESIVRVRESKPVDNSESEPVLPTSTTSRWKRTGKTGSKRSTKS